MEKVEMVIMENFESKSNKRIYSVPNYYRFNELSANIIIKDLKGKKPDTLLELDGQELYDNIKLFDLKKLTGLDRINNMVPIIDLFGKMLINTILIKDYRALYFGNERVFKDSNIRKIENVIEYISCIEDCGNIALRGDVNSLKNFIKTVVTYNFCAYRKDMVGVFNYNLPRKWGRIRRRFRWYKRI